MLHHIATISVCYGGHFESKMTAKIQNEMKNTNFIFNGISKWVPECHDISNIEIN
jgi:hypothetical protein